ncbi:ParB N-terminal domain-containing protein [Roseibium porphyridii]|uniref:ParB N-terminal domain-containing protein n=1 Tax=Roseibium porphyridii TaxID=2866279 RepID=A0ABY8FA49_9HYPH|nr:ParB N-terminal domain-containing protein [Roseibium sp. KMA01]WFE92279.1 ParB N-terminal domain-containing protein [Roseibium sp. KMA01]
MSAYQSIKISLIDIPEGRLRDVNQDWAECLAGMFVETGQKTPIDVVASGKKFTLVAGAHRLTAAKLSKWKEIDARILEPEGDQVADDLRLHEILENLGRKDFNALERCEAFHEMKRIYEAKHPEAKNGGDRRSKAAQNQRKNQNAIFAFCSSAKESTGLSRRSVELAIQTFEGLALETRERLKGTSFASKQSDLKALAGLDGEGQKRVLDMLLADPPRASTITDAIAFFEDKPPLTDSEKRFRTVCDYLPNLPPASRRNVFRQHKKEIVALVKQEGWIDE